MNASGLFFSDAAASAFVATSGFAVRRPRPRSIWGAATGACATRAGAALSRFAGVTKALAVQVAAATKTRALAMIFQCLK